MKKKLSQKENSKNAWLLGSSSFFNDIGGEMIVPLLPFYVLALGGGGISIGLLSGLREGLSSIFKIFGGWISDETGKRKPLIFFGYLISSIFKLFIAAASSWQSLIAFISLERFGKFRDAPRDAIISVDTKHSGRNLGLNQSLDVLGGIMGTLIVLFLFWKFQMETKTILYLAACISFLSIIPVFFVKEQKFKPVKISLLKELGFFNPKLKYFLLVSSVFSFANFGLYLFLLLMAKEATGSVTMSFVYYIIFNAIYALLLIPFGSLSDRIGSKKILIAGYSIFFLLTLWLFFFTNARFILPIFVAYGIVCAMNYSSHRGFVLKLSDSMKGTAFGAFYTFTGIASVVGGTIAGIFWDASPKMMFGYISFIAFIALIMLCFAREKS